MFLKELFFRFLNPLPLAQWKEQEHTGRPCQSVVQLQNGG